jgi:quercetin dioxygenase-like cupin family protein
MRPWRALGSLEQNPVAVCSSVRDAPRAEVQRAVRFAVVDGDPAAKGLVTVRFMMPAGYQIAPHWHPTDEHITVLSGTFSVGMGDKLDMDHGTSQGGKK